MAGTILDENEMNHMKSFYISDNTAYMRWSTEIEQKHDMIDGDFMRRNNIFLLFADKFAPLANFKENKQNILHKLKMNNAGLELSAGLYGLAEQTAISAIDDIQVSRGTDGFYQRALITQRHELQEEKPTESQRKLGFFNRLFSKKSEPQQPSQVVQSQ